MRSCLSLLGLFIFLCLPGVALAAMPPIVFPVTLSEAVNVTGSPRILLDVGGNSRFAVYSSGTGTNTLSFSYDATLGDVDLDGISVAAATIDLNGGTIKDLAGNDLTPLTFTAPDTSGVKVNYPSLSMDFVYDADGRYTLNGTAYDNLSAFLTAVGGTFSRASIGTYFDSSGVLQTAASGEPRFDYDPTTNTAKGILIEESRTNLLPYSILAGTTGAGNAPTGWSGTGVDGTNPITLIAGPVLGHNTEYVKLLRTAAAGYLGMQTSGYSIGFVNGTTYTISAYIRKPQGGGTARDAYLYFGTASPSTVLFASSSNMTDDWKRFYLNVTFTSNTSQVFSIITTGGSSGEGFEVALPQIEQGAFATSYIPTTSAAVTRQVDVLTIPTGSWFSTSGGAYYANFFSNYNTAQTYYTRIIGDGAGTNSWSYIGLGSDFSTLQTWNGTYINAAFSPAVSTTTPVKSAVSWSSANFTRSLVGNGGIVSTGSFSGSYSPTSIRIGSSAGQVNPPNAPIGAVKYYPIRPTDTQLQLLTQ